MVSPDDIVTFQSVCNTDNISLTNHFLEMAGGDIDTAIALYFEHGGENQLNADESNDSNDIDSSKLIQNYSSSEQKETYRSPDQARHETLVETDILTGSFGSLRYPNRIDIFDNLRPTGIFNQHSEDFMTNEGSMSDDSIDGDCDLESKVEYVEEPCMDVDEDGNIREYTKIVRKPKELTKEQRLALLFRPPFDIMAKIDLDRAKNYARNKKKWVMINIQAVDVFACQALNRDLWSDYSVKDLIKNNFIFLQYQFDSTLSQQYKQFYCLESKDCLPHIAILDPMTGERLKQWNDIIPKPSDFINDITQFLDKFSLDPKKTNPTISEISPVVDPLILTEEEQMGMAINQSLNHYSTQIEKNDDLKNHHDDTDVQLNLLKNINPVFHPEPANNTVDVTRIQIRTGDGKRLVRKIYLYQNTVRHLYEIIKYEWKEYLEVPFVLTNHKRENLIKNLNQNINDAGLKNSSLLLEKLDT